MKRVFVSIKSLNLYNAGLAVLLSALTSISLTIFLSCSNSGSPSQSLPSGLLNNHGNDNSTNEVDQDIRNSDDKQVITAWRRLDLGDGFMIRYKSDAEITAHIRNEATEYDSNPKAIIESAADQAISFLTAELFFDETRYSAVQTEFQGALSVADISLALTTLPDRAALGAAFIRLKTRPCVSGEALAAVVFQASSYRSKSQASNRVPQGEDNKPLNLTAQWDDLNKLLDVRFRGRTIGDYDQSGEVGIPDITPIAMYYGTAFGSIVEVVDGDQSGEIGIPDITPIANNYLTLLTGWNLYIGVDTGGGTYEYTKIGSSTTTIPRRDADNSERLNLYTHGVSLTNYGNYRVRVAPVGPDGVEAGSETYAEFDYAHAPSLPPIPANQRLTGLDLDFATISWDEITSPLVAEVKCWRSETGGTDLGNYILDATYDTEPFPTSHTFADLTPLTDYYFIITTTSIEAIDSVVPDPIHAFTDTPPNPPAPSNQVVSTVTPNSATVTWDAPSDPLIAEIYCWKSTTGGTDIAAYTLDGSYATTPLPTEHTFTGLDTSTQYYFAITSTSPLGRGSGIETVLEAYTSNPPIAEIDGPVSMLKGYDSPTYGIFSGAESTDPDAGDTIVEYRWNWDDGSPEEVTDQTDIVHNTWPSAGTYDVTLVVVDSHGVASAPATHPVEVIDGRTDILVVYNINETFMPRWDMTVREMSLAVAEYYMFPDTGRGISPANVVGFDWNDPATGDTEGSIEVITRNYYTDTIREDMQSFLTDSGLKNVVKYIVLCKGVPLKINNASGSGYESSDYACVDSELCLLFEDYDIAGRTVNPFRAEVTPVTQPFEPFTHNFKGNYLGEYQDVTISYLVSRLDAYTLDEVRLIVDRSKAAKGNTDGYIILDDHPSKEYDMMHDKTADNRPSATTVLTNYNANLKEDNTDLRLTAESIADDSISQNVVGFCGHGVHHGGWPSGAEYILNDLGFAYRPGAMFISYESFNGYSFNYNDATPPVPNRGGQGLIADFIRMGGTCGIGNVWEPWSDACGDESVAFVQYLKGDNSIDALYRSLRYISWCEVVIGDPLCVITD